MIDKKLSDNNKLKKEPQGFLNCEKIYYDTAKEQNLSYKLVDYVWQKIFAPSRGYSFCMAHTLAYSLVGLQELNLAYKYPIIFWNTANLIVDSGSMNLEDKILLENENEDEINENEKLKNSTIDYGRIAAAIGKMKHHGIKFTYPNINKSKLTFSPNVQEQTILYGLRGITRIGNELIKNIIANRPYEGVGDFMDKVKVNKIQMSNLIKAGTFDELYDCDREKIMDIFIDLISEQKTTLNMRNVPKLIEFGLLGDEFKLQEKIFNFNKYLKNNKNGLYYNIDNIAHKFYEQHFNLDLLEEVKIGCNGDSAKILQKTWDNIYKKEMDCLKNWIKKEQKDLLNKFNSVLFNEVKVKYANGNISKWEMDSLSFYYHEHELENLREDIYGLSNFNSLPQEPIVEREFTPKNNPNSTIYIYELNRIAGTVIDKDKNKGNVTLLTKDGVVNVKVWKNQFAIWDKQISVVGEDGKKHVAESSWFQRGNKLIVTGIKRDGSFVPKKYKNSEYPLFEQILSTDDNGFIIESTTERVEV